MRTLFLSFMFVDGLRSFDMGSGPTEAFGKTLKTSLKGGVMRCGSRTAERMVTLETFERAGCWYVYRVL